MTTISIIIPAHNEEAYIGACLDSIKLAAKKLACPVEVIVCLNRCNDNTEAIVRDYQVTIVYEEDANVAKVRNRAMSVAAGDVMVTLDADSTLSQNYLLEVERLVATGRYVAGAGLMFTDRLNLASVVLGATLVLPALLLMRFSGGMFWITRAAYEATGGFDENYLTGEDFDLWRRLRQYARSKKLKFGMIKKAHIITSARKMDDFGPWFMLTHPHWFYYAIKGENHEFADRYLYHTQRSRSENADK